MGFNLFQRIRRIYLVLCHAIQMYRNLTQRRNLQKGTWRNEDLRDLLELLEREVEELRAALWQHSVGVCGPERVAEEAADVSNYAALISDTAAHQSKHWREFGVD